MPTVYPKHDDASPNYSANSVWGRWKSKTCDNFSLRQELESLDLACRPQQDVWLANVTPLPIEKTSDVFGFTPILHLRSICSVISLKSRLAGLIN
jgi:hypothetical protein